MIGLRPAREGRRMPMSMPMPMPMQLSGHGDRFLSASFVFMDPGSSPG
jgi:hypothetical protein